MIKYVEVEVEVDLDQEEVFSVIEEEGWEQDVADNFGFFTEEEYDQQATELEEKIDELESEVKDLQRKLEFALGNV